MITKRLIDAAISLVILVLAAPICASAALAIWLESGRPILFRQRRVGKDFVVFEILKFRTMRVCSAGPSVTVRGDKRTTAVGRFLRATKIDELPQFWNVLRGEMSIVGPRPEVPEFVELFRERYERILSLRPGITDPASVRFRHEETILAQSEDPLDTYRTQILPAKLDLADRYLRERSDLRDIAIIVQTAVTTLRPANSVRPK
jgi:lipopolysaccharide/colanic/teichoic acid biosynthesis glycosyltransferase